jgi:long-chain acyl-CoA synthetase
LARSASATPRVETRSNRFAQALIALGLQPGERLAVLLENSVESLDSVFGAEKAAPDLCGAECPPHLAEHLEILADAQASAVLVGPRHGELATAFARPPWPRAAAVAPCAGPGPVDAPGVVDWRRACAAAPEPAAIEIGPDAPCAHRLHQRHHRRPKGVAYTVARLEARLANHFMAMEYGLSVDDAMLHVGPLTHAAGVYLFPCFLRGARNVVLDRFDPATLLAAVESTASPT